MKRLSPPVSPSASSPAATRSIIAQYPLSGHVFAFVNRRANRIKLLVWDRTGFLLLYKRLERGTFRIPHQPADGCRHIEVDSGELGLMLEEKRAPLEVLVIDHVEKPSAN